MSDDDPFEKLDPPEDREGDPFERLDGPDERMDDGEAVDDSIDGLADESSEPGGADAEPEFEEEFIDEEDPFAVGGEAATSDGTEPLGDDPFGGMEVRDGDPFGEGESVFQAVEVDGVDADEVWESLNEDAEEPTYEGSRYADVSKHRFCEQCEFFSSPPNAHCTHGEAEIIEYLDMETVRLLNCPVVAEQRQLEKE
jgi:hypothetical protein